MSICVHAIGKKAEHPQQGHFRRAPQSNCRGLLEAKPTTLSIPPFAPSQLQATGMLETRASLRARRTRGKALHSNPSRRRKLPSSLCDTIKKGIPSCEKMLCNTDRYTLQRPYAPGRFTYGSLSEVAKTLDLDMGQLQHARGLYY